MSPVLEQGPAPAPADRAEVAASGGEVLQIVWHITVGLTNGIFYLLDLILGPIYRPCLAVLAWFGYHFTMAARAVVVFFHYLAQHINFLNREELREWTILRHLPYMHLD
jgi:hypothetical protein